MRPRRILFLLAALLVIAALISSAAPVYAAPGPNEPGEGEAVSESDAPPHEPADFIRVPMVPLSVDIPYFYQEVINFSGMYVFALPDGTIYKRIYGCRDDVYGWYEPEGPSNIIYTDSPMIDTADDIRMYEQALQKAHVSYSDLHVPTQPTKTGADLQNYTGLLPPESGISGISGFFGIPVVRLAGFIALGVTALCIIILLIYNKRKNNPDSEPRQEYYIID